MNARKTNAGAWRVLVIARRLSGERTGVAAIEFALVLPLLVAIWLGMAELIQISMASTKATLAAQSVADLVARYSSNGYAGTGGFADIEQAATTVISPLPTDSANPVVSVVSATLNSSGTPTQAWQCTTGTMPSSYSVSSLLSSSPQVTTQNSSLGSVIMVTVSYVYTPTISGGILGSQTFTATAFSTPRTVSAVPKPC